MFELGCKPSQVNLVVSLDQKSQKSQRVSVPTDRQTLSIHRYLLIESHRRSVGTPLMVYVFYLPILPYLIYDLLGSIEITTR